LPDDTIPVPETAPRRRGFRWVFAGAHGLRSGWGILIYFLLMGVVMIPTVLVLSALGMHSQDLVDTTGSAIGAMKGEAIGLFAVVVATFGMMLIERRRPRDYGLAPQGLLPMLLQGIAAGIGLMAALAALLAAIGAIRFGGVTLQGADILRQGALWGLAFAMVGLFEELIMRGYLMAALARGLNARWALVITSVVFGLGHVSNSGEGLVGIASTVLIALVLGWSVFRTGTLWWAIGFHAAWDWSQSFLFGLGDSGYQARGVLLDAHPAGPALLSGGATGPEGSLLCLLTILAAAALVRWTLPAAPRPSGLTLTT
jgi:hypothetical protein